MTKVLIIEDEIPAVNRLKQLIAQTQSKWEVIEALDSVKASVSWLNKQPAPDLIFMDVQLADGYSFEIFKSTNIQSPVIFATAYDQFALDAFKVNGMDYLLKPITLDEFQRVSDKFEQQNQQAVNFEKLTQLLEHSQQKKYKERFLIKNGKQLQMVSMKEIAYFVSDSGYTFLHTQAGSRFIMDETLEQVKQKIDPNVFFQINRKAIVSPQAIEQIHTWFNSRLKLTLKPAAEEEVIVSRERVKEFKAWLNR